MSDMMSRFRGLILFSALILIAAGCTENLQITKPEPVSLFNREYYAVKNLNRTDLRKLDKLTKSEDKSAAKTAALIIGRHKVRNGELEEGYKMLKENLDDSYLDRFTRISGHLWLYDAAKKTGDTEAAEKQKKYLQGIRMDDKAEKAFGHYCSQEQISVTEGDLKSCVLAEEPAGESDVDIEIFEEPKSVKQDKTGAEILMEKVVVNVKDAEADPKLVEAMLYSISKMGLDVDLDFTGKKEDYDFTLDVSTKILTSKTNLYEFDIEMDVVFEEAVNLAMLNGGINLVLGYTPDLYEKAIEIEEKYKDSDINIYKFDVTDPGFQSTLKTVKEELGENATISFAVAGTEKQLTKIVPFLRFYSDKPDRSVIVCAVDGFGKLFFNNEYAEYFKGAYVVTEVILLGNSSVEKFNEDYYSDYTKLPTVKDMLGHDLIVFMEKIKNPSFLNEYLTGISSLEEGRTVRKLEAYKIITTSKIRKLVN